MEAQIISLQQLYLLSLCKMFEGEKLAAILQDFGNDTGRLWLTREGSTVPQAFVEFKFQRDEVALAVMTRDERTKAYIVKYSEGLDATLQDLQKMLRAGLLEHKVKRAA